ncbi:alpha-2-HS-glycoprotein 2 [Xiphias gladius]|uniref:alpha-2-HS-glycoprotein 2 n=1 Tax=Xiphias gladius TaxID=8245 RepID=UPI001A99C057|nr:alpha-2-HS-glycoprotein 2 [Xiphias gladius]
MKPLGITVVLGLLVGVWAQLNVLHPLCDSPEAEEAALVAQDYVNAQHTHGYKFALNRIEEIEIKTGINGEQIYVLELDLLETDCHVLDPTPVANCTVRPKYLTAIEADCDVVLKKVGGALSVTTFKCETEESTVDLCTGCFTLLPLNNTAALDFVHATLATLNKNVVNVTYIILEIGRMSSQFLSGGARYSVEYVIAEANCTGDTCVPLDDPTAERSICVAKGFKTAHTVDCKMFTILTPVVDAISTVASALPPAVHVHTGGLSHKNGLRHHKLTSHHEPHLGRSMSAESAESTEIVPVAPAVVDAAAAATPASADPTLATDSASTSKASASKEEAVSVVKRDLHAELSPAAAEITVDPIPHVQVCPGRVRFFK